MAGDEVRRVDQIFGLNGLIAETKVRNGDAARFFGIVEEVRLHVFIRMVADDLYGVFIRAYRTVGAEAVEFAGSGSCGSGVEFFGEIERGIRDVFVNTHGEMVLRLCLFEILINGKHHRRRKFF